MDSSNIVSLVVIAPHGISAGVGDIVEVASNVIADFTFVEVLILLPSRYKETMSIDDRDGLLRVAPQLRVISLELESDFDEMAIEGYKSAIGDIVVVSDLEEIRARPVMDMITPIVGGKRLVRLRRSKRSILGVISSQVVNSLTGYHVDTTFLRTMAVSRQFLSETMRAADKMMLFRFTVGRMNSRSVVLETSLPPTRVGLGSVWRRADLVARLMMTATPRLLRQGALVCGALTVCSLIAIIYILANWIFNPTVVAGWATTNILLAVMMFAQMGALTGISLAVSRLSDFSSSKYNSPVAEEWAAGDLFARATLLNVETPKAAFQQSSSSHVKVSLGVRGRHVSAPEQ